MTTCKVKLDFGEDFRAWWKEMQKILKANSMKHFNAVKYMYPRAELQEESIVASTTICSNVRPRLLLRVPSRHLLNARRLLDHLSRLCRPFRLLDLPPELRVKIFEMDIHRITDGLGTFTAIDLAAGMPRVSKLPPMAHLCRQVRAEYLHLFASSVHIVLQLPNCEDGESASRIDKMVRSWAKNNVKAYVKHLRHIDFYIYPESCALLTLTQQHGLKIGFDDNDEDVHNLEYQKRLSKYIGDIEEDRKAIDLKGESLVLALIKDPMVWIP